MTKLRYAIFVLLVWLLTSCSMATSPAPDNLVGATQPVISLPMAATTTSTRRVASSTLPPSTPMPTLTPTATKTPRPTATATATKLVGFPSPLAGSGVSQQCLAVETQLPPDFVVEGKILRDCVKAKGACYLDFQDHTVRETGFATKGWDAFFSYPRVSPNGEWLAYLESVRDSAGEVHNRWLRVVSKDGQQQPVRPLDPRWGKIINWLDNERLMLIEPEVYTLSALVINAFTGQSQEIDPDSALSEPYPYPGDSLIPQPIRFYDPTLTRVIYPTEPMGYALWDVQSQKLVWERRSPGSISYPEWSPDGTRVLVAVKTEARSEELISVDLDGQETQLTNLAAAYPSLYVYIGSYHWSPDGRHIAFWFNVNQDFGWSDTWHLAILDLETGQTTDYCLPYLYGQNNLYFEPFFYWSPSGKQLVTAYSLIVVDLERNVATQTATDGGFLLGWMK